MRARVAIAILWGGLGLAWPAAAPAGEATARLELDAGEATVGDHIAARILLDAPAEAMFEPPRIGPELGQLTVVSGSWRGPEETEEGLRWVWEGGLAAYRTGSYEVPPIPLEVRIGEEALTVATAAVPVTLDSVLAAEDLDSEEPEIADLKPPASVAPEYAALWLALGLLLAVLLVALALWWVHRRYASRLAAAEVPADPFHRTPPHVWVYAELQKLLDERLPERGEVDRFFAALSWIVKRYLGGRYRVELLEQTSSEVGALLRQSGVEEDLLVEVAGLLELCDGVKFALERPEVESCREVVQRVYRVVDRTKPAEPARAAGAA